MPSPVSGPLAPGPADPGRPVPAPPATATATATAGEVPPGVARALARLGELEGKAVPEHVEVFDGVHRLLQDALATLDGN